MHYATLFPYLHTYILTTELLMRNGLSGWP